MTTNEELVDALRAERDAALAAIARVRAEAEAYAEQPDVMELCGAVAQALRTALDGAPELDKAWDYYRKNLARSVESNKRKQNESKTKAGNHRSPWTREDDEVLDRDDLSLVEKAEILGRTYFAVERRHADRRRKALLPVEGEGK